MNGMDVKRNDLVVHLSAEPRGRLIRVGQIEAWPSVEGGTLVEDAAVRCHGKMIVFDRLVPFPPASTDELRFATKDEIENARRTNLLPPEERDDDDADGSDRTPAGMPPGGRGGSVSLARPEES